MEEVRIEKLVHGGQGIGVLSDGRKVFVWNALPGELVSVQITKKRRDYAEGIAQKVLEPSTERIEPLDEAYLSTSPWQIMGFDAENKHKKAILAEAFAREKVELPDFELESAGEPLHYRNKMEYSFWGDNDGLHLALFHRASHGKRIITGSSIARPEIDKAAGKIIAVLNKNGIRGSLLKTLILRTNTSGEVVAALFVKHETFPKIQELGGICKGLVVYLSNPKSPASVITRGLHSFGDTMLTDKVGGVEVRYGVNSFFQVNLPIFEVALAKIAKHATGSDNIVDMYSGVGTIGLAVGAQTLVEVDDYNIDMAKQNAAGKAEAVQASTENATDYISSDAVVIFDPPRAGLHTRVIDRILEAKPKKIIYLSCNPSTQARDVASLDGSYTITDFAGYNFFPRTPHIESLVILESND